ncbi:MAG TPA: aminopeptidase [Fimbriimonadaceae bacterium]|nr:aminopeptidase [Fimbriimonadaceae bacterium]
MRSFEQNLALYAELTIREGVGLQPSQELLLFAEIGDAPFVRLLVSEAYRLGAKNVEVMWSDSQVTLARFQEGSDEAISYAQAWLLDGVARAHREGAARLAVASADPGLLSGISPERIATHGRIQGAARKAISELVAGFAINWCVVGAASPAWAAKVFPGLPAEEAVAKLWDAIFLTSRVHESNPIAAWVAHSEGLERRVEQLNGLRFDALHFRGPGTDLRIGLVENHLWAGGRGRAKNGVICSPNIPTEEVFCMPHRLRVDGKVSSTKPLSVRGQVLEGIEVEFKGGEAVRVSARQGQETLQRLIDTDDGAKRLGEVALVPNSAKVAQAGILFYNTLYDENAASHIALGASYAENLDGYDSMSEEERLAHGANDSIIHVDWMIGSAQVDVDGLAADGSPTPLMRAGEWV